MSTPPAAVTAPGDPAARPTVVPTDSVFAAVLLHLNRDATIALFEQLGRDLDDHCRALVAAQVRLELAAQPRFGRRGWLALLLVALVTGGLSFATGLVCGRSSDDRSGAPSAR